MASASAMTALGAVLLAPVAGWAIGKGAEAVGDSIGSDSGDWGTFDADGNAVRQDGSPSSTGDPAPTYTDQRGVPAGATDAGTSNGGTPDSAALDAGATDGGTSDGRTSDGGASAPPANGSGGSSLGTDAGDAPESASSGDDGA